MINRNQLIEARYTGLGVTLGRLCKPTYLPLRMRNDGAGCLRWAANRERIVQIIRSAGLSKPIPNPRLFQRKHLSRGSAAYFRNSLRAQSRVLTSRKFTIPFWGQSWRACCSLTVVSKNDSKDRRRNQSLKAASLRCAGVRPLSRDVEDMLPCGWVQEDSEPVSTIRKNPRGFCWILLDTLNWGSSVTCRKEWLLR